MGSGTICWERGHYRLAAAQSLLRSRDTDRARDARPPVDPEVERQARMYREMKSMTDSKLEQHIEDFLKEKQAAADARALGPAGGLEHAV